MSTKLTLGLAGWPAPVHRVLVGPERKARHAEQRDHLRGRERRLRGPRGPERKRHRRRRRQSRNPSRHASPSRLFDWPQPHARRRRQSSQAERVNQPPLRSRDAAVSCLTLNIKRTYHEFIEIKEAQMQTIATYALRDIAEIAALGAFLIMIALIARAIGS